MEIQFRKCGIDRVEELRSLSIQTFSDAFASQNDPVDFESYLEKAFSIVQLKQELGNPDSSFFFVEDGGRTIGYLKLNSARAQTDLKEDSAMELERIYVVADYQRKGVGQQMLCFAEELAITKGKDYLWLGVWEQNSHAIRFYERFGYLKFGEHPYYIGTDKQTDWLLKKKLK